MGFVTGEKAIARYLPFTVDSKHRNPYTGFTNHKNVRKAEADGKHQRYSRRTATGRVPE